MHFADKEDNRRSDFAPVPYRALGLRGAAGAVK